MSDPLSVAAAIIGIIAAAGKVAEILGPLVSNVKDVRNTARDMRDQVEESRTILQALQKLFENLDQSPRRRRELIQIDQLRTTLCDGIVIFSDLETLVLQLSASSESLRSRVQWARKRDQLETYSKRLERFKSSINTMLNILQCESDLEAAANRQELYKLTTQLLQSNRDLRRRLSVLENGSCDDGSSIYLQTDQRTSLDSIRFQIRAFEFERDLKESWVYRKVRRSTADASFRSSLASSHAWSALSAISLSDISAISVVALPISSNDLSNGHHYRQGKDQPGVFSPQQGKELVIGPPTLISSTIPAKILLEMTEPCDNFLQSFDENKAEEDFWVPQWNKSRLFYYFNTLSEFYSLWDPRTTPPTTSFSFIPQVNRNGKLFYYNQATKIRTEELPPKMAAIQKNVFESNAQLLLDLFPTFRDADAIQMQAPSTKQTSGDLSPISGRFTRFLEEYKLVIVGAGCVGKSYLTIQFIQSNFVNEFDPTTENSYRKPCSIDYEPALLDILDTAGGEEYSAMREQYMRAGQGFMIVYSITNRASFEEAMFFQQQILRVKDSDYFPMILVGNYCDRGTERVISVSEGQKLAQQFGCHFIEVSTESRTSINKAFYDLVRDIRIWATKSAPRPVVVGLPGRTLITEQKAMKLGQPHDLLKVSNASLPMEAIEELEITEITTPTTQRSPVVSMPTENEKPHSRRSSINEVLLP